MKKPLLILAVLCFSYGSTFAQARILTWSIGEPVVDCAGTTVCYPVQVAIDDENNSPTLNLSTIRFFFDSNYLSALSVNAQNLQNGYTYSIQTNNSGFGLGDIFGFSTPNGGAYVESTLTPNFSNLIPISNTPTFVFNLCFDITAAGVAIGENDLSLCAPFVFDNNHLGAGNGIGADDSYFQGNAGMSGTYSINSSIVSNLADDEVINLGWNDNGNAFDGTVNLGAGDTTGSTDTTDCIPYLCTVEYIQNTTGFWDIPGNWVDGVVPTVNDDAIIAADVVSTVRQDQAVNSLVLEQGTTGVTTVTIGDTFTVNIKENVTNNGEFTGDGEVLLDGTVNQDMLGTGDYENLRIDNTLGVDVLNVTLTDPTEINGVLYVDNGDFTTSNNVLFPCFFQVPSVGSTDFENGKAGQIGPIGAGGSITGDVRVEQCYPGRRAYRYVTSSVTTDNSIQDNWQENATSYTDFPANATQVDTSPIINGIVYGFGTHITGVTHGNGNAVGQQNLDQTDGLDWQPSGNASMFEFNEATQDFDPVLVTEPASLATGKAYNMIIRGSREVDLTTNASPTYNTKLRSTGTAEKGFTYSSSVNSGQYMLVGNPFHAIVDMKAVYANNSSALGQFMYAFDPTLGGSPDSNPTSTLLAGRGAFVTIDLNDPTNVNENSIGEMRHFLQAYQGVFLLAEVNSPTLTFSEAHKSVDQEQIDVFSTPTDRIEITLYDQQSYTDNNTADDRVVINFGQTKSSSVNNNDALKFFNPDENLGRLEGSSLLAIEDREMPQIGEILELYTTNYRTTNYIFVVKVDRLLDNTVTLFDNYTGTETVLNNDAFTAVNFTVDHANPVSEATDRFELRFAASTLGTTDFDLQGISVYPNPASDVLNVNLGDNTGRFESLELFDINGRLIANKNLSNNVLDVQMDVNSFSSGVYILKVSSDSEQFSTKVIIE